MQSDLNTTTAYALDFAIRRVVGRDRRGRRC